MGDIIEKLGIGHTESGDEAYERCCDMSTEMLEALIEDVIEYENILDIGGFPTPPMTKRCNRNLAIIEKATNKTWTEIKELIQ